MCCLHPTCTGSVSRCHLWEILQLAQPGSQLQVKSLSAPTCTHNYNLGHLEDHCFFLLVAGVQPSLVGRHLLELLICGSAPWGQSSPLLHALCIWSKSKCSWPLKGVYVVCLVQCTSLCLYGYSRVYCSLTSVLPTDSCRTGVSRAVCNNVFSFNLIL